MIRLTWLQLRIQAAVALAGLVVVAIVCAFTGPHLHHLYDTTVATCRIRGDCSIATPAFLHLDTSLRTWVGVLVIVVPGIIGVFWGAPLVARELETGTFRVAWTQSVTRTHWLAVKLGVVALLGMVVAGLLSLMASWWASPLDRAGVDLYGTFDQRDVVPIGYAAFAFALGATAGLLFRRTLPAMATTLVAFVTVRLAFIHWVRPHLLAPSVRDFALDPRSTGFGSSSSLFSGSGSASLEPSPPHIPNAWVISTKIVDGSGRPLTSKVLDTLCPGIGQGGPPPGGGSGSSHSQVPAGVQNALQNCVARVGATYHGMLTYQPAGRYWAIQWYELAIYLGAALVLGGGCLWWVRRSR